MFRHEEKLKQKVQELRKQGFTYSEILHSVGFDVSKSTLSLWCREVELSENQKSRINKIILTKIVVGRRKALFNHKTKRDAYFLELENKYKHLNKILLNLDTAKIALSILYAAEGAKKEGRAALMLGNSDPKLVNLFLRLLRTCYQVDESKLRFTLQCRYDQDTKSLITFWSKITSIPISQCYKTQVDPRTVGKPSKKLNYKGVCRIDYFSANVYNELQVIYKILSA